jgi:hypothetical protein
MIAELDTALYGYTTARDMTPQEVWLTLLNEVSTLARWVEQ